MTILHINVPRWSEVRAKMLHCPTCGQRRNMCCRFQDWYGWTVTCLTCGETWTDGEMHERPFKPRWRQESVKSARRLLAHHTEGSEI